MLDYSLLQVLLVFWETGMLAYQSPLEKIYYP